MYLSDVIISHMVISSHGLDPLVTLFPGAHLSYLLITVAYQHPPFLIPLHGLTQEILGLKL